MIRRPGYIVAKRSGGSPAVPVTGDPIALTVIDSTAPVTVPTNNIDGSGWVAAVTFKGMATGQTLDPSKISFTVSEPGFDSTGTATTVSRTITGTKALRMPLYGDIWTSGTTYTAGTGWSNYVYTKTGGNNTTRIYRCTSAGGGAASTQPVHTTGSSTGADGYTWLFVANTTQSDSPPQFAIEAVSGSDAVVYVVLDRAVSSGATITAVNIQAGAYGGTSRASTPAFVTTTNSSTFSPYKPDVAWITPPWQMLQSGQSMPVEIAAIHPFGQSGRTVAAVKFTVYDNSNNATSVTSTVTSMTQSTVLTTTYGNPVPVFAWSLSQATLAAAGLADGMYSIRAEVFPFMGAKWDSDADGFGSTGTWSLSTTMPGNNAKRIPFELDSDNSVAIYYALVDGVGGGSPTSSTNVATARANPFATVSAAVADINTKNGSTKAAQVYIKGGTTLTGFGGSLETSRTYSTVWMTIQKDPNDGGVVTINADTVTSANRNCGRRTKFYNVTLAGSTTAVIDNVEGTSIGSVTHELWFDNCIITGTGTQQPLSRHGWFTITNCSLSGTANMIGNTRTAWAMCAASTVTAAGTVSGAIVGAVNALGNKMQNKATIGNPVSRYWNDNSQRVATGIWAFNTWYNCTANVTWEVRCNSTRDSGASVTVMPYTVGASWVQNLIESNDANAKGGQISADSVPTAAPRIYNMFNTAAGDGQNIAYNEAGITVGNNFATTIGTPTIVVTEASHNRSIGDIVTITQATAVATVTLNGTWTITAITGSTWTFTAGSNASSTTTGGGASAVVTGQVKKVAVSRFNALIDRNIKSDWWDNGTGSAALPIRTGAWFGRYGVDWLANGVTTATNATPSPSNLGGEVLESRSFLSGTASWTSDASKNGTTLGNGDYRPTTSSSFKGMVGATEQIFPFDLNGTTRKTDGTGACGAFEWA